MKNPVTPQVNERPGAPSQEHSLTHTKSSTALRQLFLPDTSTNTSSTSPARAMLEEGNPVSNEAPWPGVDGKNKVLGNISNGETGTATQNEPVAGQVFNIQKLEHPTQSSAPDPVTTLAPGGKRTSRGPHLTIGIEPLSAIRGNCIDTLDPNCGRKMRFELWQNGMGRTSYAIIGGVISIDNTLYIMTSAHSLLKDLRQPPGWHFYEGTSEASSSIAKSGPDLARDTTTPLTPVDSNSGDSSEPDTPADSDEDSQPDSPIDSKANLRANEVHFNKLVTDLAVSDIVYSLKGDVSMPGTAQKRSSLMSDWALIKMDPRLYWSPVHKLHQLTSIMPEYHMTAGYVYILAGANTICTGYVPDLSESIQCDDGIMNARKIRLDSPLPRDVSGAWVVSQSMLCGYVVGGMIYDDHCFMISMECTFREIEDLFNSKVIFGQELHKAFIKRRETFG